MDSHLKALILARINEVAKEETENLVLTPKALDEYLRIVGKVQGLRVAIDIIEGMYTEYMKS